MYILNSAIMIVILQTILSIRESSLFIHKQPEREICRAANLRQQGQRASEFRRWDETWVPWREKQCSGHRKGTGNQGVGQGNGAVAAGYQVLTVELKQHINGDQL